MKLHLKKLKCMRCTYIWIPRKEEVRLCPRCKSAYWDKSKEKKELLTK